MAKSDFNTTHLRGLARKVADEIVAFYRERLGEDPDGGGCRAFYGAAEWRERGEAYGQGSVLVVVHDGGALSPYLGLREPGAWRFYEALQERLHAKHGVYMEACTSWYTSVHLVADK